MDLQGPKLRVGKMAEGGVELEVGQSYRFDLDKTPGDGKRAPLPHKEIIGALKPGDDLLIDDGRIRLRIEKKGKDFVVGLVTVGGRLTDRKGVNVPGVVLPLAAADREGPRRPRLRPGARRRLGRRSPSCSGPRTSPRRAG